MNQTNVVTQSTKSIPVSPYSKTPQPKTIPSAKHPLKKAVDKPLPKPKPVTTLEEAQEVLRYCQECVTNVQSYETNVRSATATLRWVVYQAYLQDVPKLLGMDKEEFELAVSSAVTNNIHRSTVNRICLAVRMEVAFKIPFGEMKESVFRALRTKVPRDKCRKVLALALKKKGSYSKITAKDIEAAARELGYLNTTSDHPAEINNHGEAVQAWFQEYSKHQNALQRLLKKFDIQPAQIKKVVALVKHQYQQLDNLLSEIG